MSSLQSNDMWVHLIHIHGLFETFFIIYADELEVVNTTPDFPGWITYRHRTHGTHFTIKTTNQTT